MASASRSVPKASSVAYEARDLAQQAISRIEVIETRMEERQKNDAERHEETRRLIVELKNSFSENFLALQRQLSDALEKGLQSVTSALESHAKEDEVRFGIISKRSWAAMWTLVGAMGIIILGLAGTIWKLTGH